jgi:hypothetical protein
VITDQEFGPIFKEKENEPNQPTALRSASATQHQSTQLRQKQSAPKKSTLLITIRSTLRIDP